MPLFRAAPEDLPAIAQLVNSAYRGESSRRGWTTEADFLGGQRTDVDSLARDLAINPGAQLLMMRDEPHGPLLGSVWLEPLKDGATWLLGMLTVRPDLQDQQHGRGLLGMAEQEVRTAGGRCVRITVISIRDALIAWYERRGYARTGATRPWPYDDPAIGRPTVPDLAFVVLSRAI